MGDRTTNVITSDIISNTYQYDAASQLTQTLSIPISGPGAGGEVVTSTREYDNTGQMYHLREYTSTRTLRDVTLTYDAHVMPMGTVAA